jgi:hypothetical protein
MLSQALAGLPCFDKIPASQCMRRGWHAQTMSACALVVVRQAMPKFVNVISSRWLLCRLAPA